MIQERGRAWRSDGRVVRGREHQQELLPGLQAERQEPELDAHRVLEQAVVLGLQGLWILDRGVVVPVGFDDRAESLDPAGRQGVGEATVAGDLLRELAGNAKLKAAGGLLNQAVLLRWGKTRPLVLEEPV